MCRRNLSRPSSKRRLTKKLKRLSSGCSALGSAMGVVDEHRLSTKGPLCAAGTFWPAPSAPAVAPDVSFGVGVIDRPRTDAYSLYGPQGGGFDGLGVHSIAPGARSWQLRRHRNPSFRPVALRPRLSTGLPLSQGPSVEASRMTVKSLYCVQHL